MPNVMQEKHDRKKEYGPYPGVHWTNWRCNISFLRDLLRDHGYCEFTLEMAYDTYFSHGHRRDYGNLNWHGSTDDYWREMCVRNTISATIYRGYLVRVSKGVYQFPRTMTVANMPKVNTKLSDMERSER